MRIVYDKNFVTEGRKQELDQMVERFSDAGCLFVEDLFMDFVADYECCGLDRSCDKLAVTFDDELGNELTFILSRGEIQYVLRAITKKLDSMTVDDGGGGFGDED